MSRPSLTGAGGGGRSAVAAVLDTLHLERLDADTYLGGSLPWPRGRVYGGQVLAQALLAAGATVDPGRSPHSVHGYFLRAGDPALPITFAVERLNDGRSFSARRTHAIQDGRPILSMITSFQEHQPGVDHATPAPAVPPPDRVASLIEIFAGLDDRRAQDFVATAAFDMRHVEGSLFPVGGGSGQPSTASARAVASGAQAVWMRSRAAIDDDAFNRPDAAGRLGATPAVLHAALLAFSCDQIMLEPVLRRHGLGWLYPGLKVASLDHAMWWHRPARADEWLLYVQAAPSAQGGRGLGTSMVYSEDGTLVASIAQEGMVRIPTVS